MQFEVTTPVPPVEVPKDSYTVEVTTIQGDADGDTLLTAGPFKRGRDEANLQSVVETLQRVEKRFPQGMTGMDTYDDVLGFLPWFGEEIAEANDIDYFWRALDVKVKDREAALEANAAIIPLAQGFGFHWPSDALTDYRSPESLSEYNVFYYDEHGKKFNVGWK